jgi:hypothetical protein
MTNPTDTVVPTAANGILAAAGARPSGPTPPSGSSNLTQPRPSRIAALAATLTLLVATLFAAFALPAQAATIGGDVGSGVGTAQHPVASKPTGSSSGLVFGGLCLGGIVATAGGVLWYTVRTRRTLDTDRR